MLVNKDTQLIQEDISTLLVYHFSTYGVVPAEVVKDHKNEIRLMSFHPADPLIMLYGPIEKLQKLTGAARISYTPEQSLDISIRVIKNIYDFERTLMDKTAKPAQDKLLVNFKSHFTAAQKILKEIRGPSMKQIGCHQVNMVISQLRDTLTIRNNEMLAMMQQPFQGQTLPSDTPEEKVGPPNHQAKAATSDNLQFEMLRIFP